MRDEVRIDICIAITDSGELRIEFAIHGRHGWLTFRGDDLDVLKKAVDAAIAQRGDGK